MTPPDELPEPVVQHLLESLRMIHRLLAFTIILGTLALTAAVWALLLVLP